MNSTASPGDPSPAQDTGSNKHRAVTRTTKPSPAATSAPVMTLEYADPAKLKIDTNVRLDPRLDAEFLTDIAANGVNVPVDAVRAGDGEIMVWDGQRRILAAVQAAWPSVPVLITPTTQTGDAARNAARTMRQARLNLHREDLTAGEIAAAAQTLFDLQVPAGQIAKSLGLHKGQLAAARKVAASKVASAHAAKPGLNLEQAAALAEFDDNPDLAAELAKFATDNPGLFQHKLQQVRDDVADDAAIAAHAAKLEAKGIKVTDMAQSYENNITYWAGEDGKELTSKTHKACPGNVVLLRVHHAHKVTETWYCTDPKSHGHKKVRGGAPEQTTEERREVRQNNKAWRSATTVREDWLRDTLLAGKTAPAGAVRFTAATFASAEWPLVRAMTGTSGIRHKMARTLLRIENDHYEGSQHTRHLDDALLGVPDQRATVIMLALAIGAYEQVASEPDGWRNCPELTASYLTALQAWGYTLSPLEGEVVSPTKPAKPGPRTGYATAPAVDTTSAGQASTAYQETAATGRVPDAAEQDPDPVDAEEGAASGSTPAPQPDAEAPGE